MSRVEQRISGDEGNSQKFDEKDNAVDIVTQTDEGKETRVAQRRKMKAHIHSQMWRYLFGKLSRANIQSTSMSNTCPMILSATLTVPDFSAKKPTPKASRATTLSMSSPHGALTL